MWKSPVIAACAAICLSAMACAEDARPSEDCARAESALRYWAGAMAVVMPDPNSEAARTEAAAAGKSMRLEAQDIESTELRTKVEQVASAFDRLGSPHQTPQAPAFPDAPSKDYFAATTAMNATLAEIKKICPTLGDDVVPTAG